METICRPVDNENSNYWSPTVHISGAYKPSGVTLEISSWSHGCIQTVSAAQSSNWFTLETRSEERKSCVGCTLNGNWPELQWTHENRIMSNCWPTARCAVMMVCWRLWKSCVFRLVWPFSLLTLKLPMCGWGHNWQFLPQELKEAILWSFSSS